MKVRPPKGLSSPTASQRRVDKNARVMRTSITKKKLKTRSPGR